MALLAIGAVYAYTHRFQTLLLAGRIMQPRIGPHRAII